MRPLVALPVSDHLVVALNGPAFGNLATPLGRVQNLPQVAGMVSDAEFSADHRGDPFQRPQIVGKAIRQRPGKENLP